MISRREAKILAATEVHVKREMDKESSGHDWLHVKSVERNAVNLQRFEGGDLHTIRMAALLHDIGDMKLHGGDTTAARRLVGSWLDEVNVHGESRNNILYIIDNMSFYKSLTGFNGQKSIEFMVVQDADRLEAIGAIGIARALHYGGAKGRKIYAPDVEATPLTAERYGKEGGSKDSITHFHEKLLGLRDTLNTETAKKVAESRHKLIVDYLKQFYREFSGADFNF